MNALLVERLLEAGYALEQLREEEHMAAHTTMRVGGPAELLALPETIEQVQRAMAIARELGREMLVIGNGSNLIVRDGGVRGLVLKLGEGFSAIRVEGETIFAQAGAKLAQVGAEALRQGLTGFEFAAGIPGSVGGGCAMNAGAYGAELKDVLIGATVLIDGEVVRFSPADFAFGYRTTNVLRKRGVVLEAEFGLQRGEPAQIQARMSELNARRRDKQPLAYPSAGSVFKRPEGHFAGALIERAGLKGTTIGGARVSEKHAGFIVNAQGAKARDVIDLIEHVQRQVMAHAGVQLECEVRIIGED